MNCFFLSLVIAECAAFHCDKHCVKMILELAQMLYTAHAVNNRKVNWRRKAPENSYKITHTRHPTAIWVRSALANYRFMAELGMALCLEYTHRYGRTHKTETHIAWLLKNQPDFPPPKDHDQPPPTTKGKPKPVKPVYFSKTPCLPGMTPIPLAMPEECYKEDAVLAYREYYIRHKQRFAKWTKREVPKWFTVGVERYTIEMSKQEAEQKKASTALSVKKESLHDSTTTKGKRVKKEGRHDSVTKETSRKRERSAKTLEEPLTKRSKRATHPRQQLKETKSSKRPLKSSSKTAGDKVAKEVHSAAQPGKRKKRGEQDGLPAKRRAVSVEQSGSQNSFDSLLFRRSLRVRHLPAINQI